MLSEAETNVGGEFESGEWVTADDWVINCGEDGRVYSDPGDNGCSGGCGVVFVSRGEAGSGRGIEFIEVVESAGRSAGACDGECIIPLR